MGLRERISDGGKKILLRPAVMRWVSDDRVMRAAEGLMDAPKRMKAAWRVLLNGHELPNIDPALDDSIGEIAPSSAREPKSKTNGAAAGPVSVAKASGSADLLESMKERNTLS